LPQQVIGLSLLEDEQQGEEGLGTGGLVIFFFAMAIYQLADRDNRSGLIWGGGNLAASMISVNVVGLGGIAIWLVFVGTLAALIYTKPIKRNG
jgi:hypothetical protein